LDHIVPVGITKEFLETRPVQDFADKDFANFRVRHADALFYHIGREPDQRASAGVVKV